MAKDPDKIKNFNELDYSKHAEILVKFIKKNWDIGKPAPKGYKEFLKNKESDYEGMEELDEEKIMKSFKGFDDSSAGSNAFPIRMSLPHIAYDDTEQGRDPLTMLVSCILTYGMKYGQVLERTYESSSMNYKVKQLEHCMSMGKSSDDLSEKTTWELQHTDLAKVGNDDWIAIGKKWDKIREEVKALDWSSLGDQHKDKLWDDLGLEEINKDHKKFHEDFISKCSKVTRKFSPYSWRDHNGEVEYEKREYVFMKYKEGIYK